MFQHTIPHLGEIYKEARWEEARKAHDLRLLKASRPRLGERTAIRIGNLLVFLGLRVLERYRPVLHCGPEVYPTAAGR